MLKRIVSLLSLLLLIACSADPVLDIEQLETRARGGDEQAMTQIVELLASKEPELADRVYTIVIELGPKIVPSLLAQVGSADRQLREYVIAALGTFRSVEAVPSIGKVLADPTLGRRYVAAWALGEIGDPAVVPALIGALGDDNNEVRRYATRALIKLNRTAVEPLIDYLGEAKGEGAAAAIRALGDITDRRALDVLLGYTAGEQRSEAFLALGKLRDPRAETALIKGLEDGDSLVRMNAAMALGPLGGEQAAIALQATLEDDVHVVREWSARSLEMITGQAVLYRDSLGEYVRPYQVYH